MRMLRIHPVYRLIPAVLLVLALLIVPGCAPDIETPQPVPPATSNPSTAPGTTPTKAPEVPSTMAVYELVSPAEAAALIAEQGGNVPFVILDVRTPDEYTAGHIEGAIVWDVNQDDFATSLGMAYPRDGRYVVYCRSGVRSRAATEIMQSLGFTDIYEIDGGIQAWEAAGLPVEIRR
jgi:rhodanese-related sulfurtransferase